MASELDKKLGAMTHLDCPGHGVGVDCVEQIKQAFIDDGWVKLHGRGAYDTLEESMRLIQQPLMSGQEWYARFESELEETPTHIETQRISKSLVLGAAKKAAGVE